MAAILGVLRLRSCDTPGSRFDAVMTILSRYLGGIVYNIDRVRFGSTILEKTDVLFTVYRLVRY